ncbi:MAG TPA: hypothetical protein VF594_12400 [Rubricoccaceae bacterium]|jgi:hypothetical protein
MDALGDLLPFLIAAGYLMLKFGRRKDRPKAAPKPPAPPRRVRDTTGPTPFEQLLARLEAETDAVTPRAASPPARSSTVAPEPPSEFTRRAPLPESTMFADNRAALAADRARTEAATAFRPAEAPRPERAAPERGFEAETRGFEHERRDFEHERHGFGADNPLAETSFSQARDADRRPAPRRSYDPHGLTPAETPPAPGGLHFGSAAAVRNAFVFATVLGRRPPLRSPGARRPRPNA